MLFTTLRTQMAGYEVLRTHLQKFRLFRAAALCRFRTSGAEPAAFRRINQIRRIARNPVRNHPLRAVDVRETVQKPLGVRMHRVIENIIHCAQLRDFSGIHDRDLIAGFT